jgi:hypothetical protein
VGHQALANVTSLPVRVILRTVWNDLGEVWIRLRRQSIIGLAIVLLFEIVGAIPGISGNRLLSEALSLMSKIATLPLEIAIFRLLILDETEPGYPFAMSTVRFQRMLGWTVGLWAFTAVPSYVAEAVPNSTTAAAVIAVMLVVIGLVVLIRLSLLLPAIAVDAPGASVRNSVADTKGHAWMIVKPYLTIFVVFVLIVMAAAALAGLTGLRAASGSLAKGSLASSAFVGSVAFVALCAGTIVAARLFMSLGERLKDAAAVPA